MVMEGMPKPREHVLVRRWDKHGEKVTPVCPSCSAKVPETRRPIGLFSEVARFARQRYGWVIVNRYWQLIFGWDSLRRPSFWRQGESPPNVELLDWLAVEFRESG